jgi:hypothetical protein
MRHLNEFASGTYAGTGAAVSITCGFKPQVVMIWNVTDGDTLWFHLQGMTDATSIKIDAAVAAGTNGVTLSSSGFSVGTDISESAKTMRYFAF